MPYITQERLRELFDYSDGYFVRKINAGKTGKVGDIVKGSNNPSGYKYIKIDGKNFRYHRVIWVWHYGDIANDLQIDHRNGIRDDNKIENIRVVKQHENQQNRKLNKNNTSGSTGVRWKERLKKWEAAIKHKNKIIYLGSFENKTDAANAYLKAKKELHTAQPIPRFL